jgi:hypothetical protein
MSIPVDNDETRDLLALEADISARLRTACAHFPESEFEDLVRQIARIELKYARTSPQGSGAAS